MRTIEIDPFKQSDINKAIKKLKEYSVWVQQKSEELIDRLADIGVEVASITFDNNFEPYVSNNIQHDVHVYKLRDGNGYAISAQGKDVCFLEFGAGVYYNGSGMYPTQTPNEIVGIGEYGHGWGKRRGWVFKDTNGNAVFTRGNPPAMAMWQSEQAMIDAVTSVAREVFRG